MSWVAETDIDKLSGLIKATQVRVDAGVGHCLFGAAGRRSLVAGCACGESTILERSDHDEGYGLGRELAYERSICRKSFTAKQGTQQAVESSNRI
jgi:hypothetical protein